jgi:hypothetical protein
MTRVSTIACLTVWLCCACSDDDAALSDTPTAASMMDPDDAIAALRERAAVSFSAITLREIPQAELADYEVASLVAFLGTLSGPTTPAWFSPRSDRRLTTRVCDIGQLRSGVPRACGGCASWQRRARHRARAYSKAKSR